MPKLRSEISVWRKRPDAILETGQREIGYRERRKLSSYQDCPAGRRGRDPLYTQAFSGIDLNADQKALVEMVVNTINSRDKHVIEFTGFVLSKEGDLAFAEKLSEAGLPVDLIRERNDGIPVSIIASFFGEGATTETVGGTHTVIITSMSHPFSRSLTTGHELFGHGRSLSLGRNQTQHEDAIWTENLIRRVMGINEVNDGRNHSDKRVLSNPNLLPAYR